MPRIGYLYDNVSRNTGDLAIGLSIQKILLDIGISKNDFREMIPGISNPDDYENIIVGGGLIIRNRGDFFYDKFRIKGEFILNSVGIHDNPLDLNYLNNYKYLSVRSIGDKNKLNYLTKDINVIPDTTLLLEDIPTSIRIKKPSIGIHCYSNNNFYQIDKIIKKYSKDFYIYLIPITHYNYDYEFLEKLYFNNINEKILLLPQMSPLEIFTIIGKFNYFISYSLHGAYFSYKHNVPFILFDNPDDTKMKYFMNDRNLENYLFNEKNEIDFKLTNLLKNNLDYSSILLKDLNRLESYKKDISQLIGKSKKTFIIKPTKKEKESSNNVYTKMVDDFLNQNIKKKSNKFKNKEINELKDRLIMEIVNKESNDIVLLKKITASKFYKLWKIYCKIKKILIKKD